MIGSRCSSWDGCEDDLMSVSNEEYDEDWGRTNGTERYHQLQRSHRMARTRGYHLGQLGRRELQQTQEEAGEVARLTRRRRAAF